MDHDPAPAEYGAAEHIGLFAQRPGHGGDVVIGVDPAAAARLGRDQRLGSRLRYLDDPDRLARESHDSALPLTLAKPGLQREPRIKRRRGGSAVLAHRGCRRPRLALAERCALAGGTTALLPPRRSARRWFSACCRAPAACRRRSCP